MSRTYRPITVVSSLCAFCAPLVGVLTNIYFLLINQLKKFIKLIDQSLHKLFDFQDKLVFPLKREHLNVLFRFVNFEMDQ